MTRRLGPSNSLRGFIAAAARSPREVGTFLPSGPHLARRLAAVVPRRSADGGPPVVVEAGAGDGAISWAIAERLGPGSTFVAIERDPQLADALRVRCPTADVVTADVDTLTDILHRRGHDAADAIVSVLPWTLLDAQRQRQLLDVIRTNLRPTGVFTAVAYASAYPTRPARRFRARLRESFDEVVPTRTVWRNLPPAMTYVCRYPVQ